MNNLSLLIICLAVYLATYLFTPVVIRWVTKLKVLSIPNTRSIHKNAHPCSGGLSFGIPVLISLIIISIFIDDLQLKSTLLKLFLGSLFILILGFIDDKYILKARYKLLFQSLISIFSYLVGFKIIYLTNPFGNEILLNYLSFPFTFLWFLIVMNAINLIDGMDGLATGITIISSLVLLFSGYYYNNIPVFYTSAILLSACFAFFKYNYPPSKIFMGDSGSLFIGYQLACISIIGSSQLKGITAMTLLIPITVLFIPLFDTITSIYRRIKKGKSIFQADKDHIHHQLLNFGFSEKMVLLIALFVTLLFALIAIGYIFINRQVMLIVLFVLSIVLGLLFYYLLKKEFFK